MAHLARLGALAVAALLCGCGSHVELEGTGGGAAAPSSGATGGGGSSSSSSATSGSSVSATTSSSAGPGATTTGGGGSGAGTTTGAGGAGGVCGTFELSGDAACQSCAEQACCVDLAACTAGTPCADYEQCVVQCSFGDLDCGSACDQQTGGEQAWTNAFSCVGGPCAGDCLSALCVQDVFTEVACATCINASCCAELEACWTDQACQDCLVGAGAPSCWTTPLMSAFGQCWDASCAGSCP